MNRKILTLCLFLLVGAGLSACNTAEGFGKDLSGAGDSIQGVFN
ncbi:MAG: entericidin EcnA/B family protein [Alphaproteobacteria bacterium]